MQTLNQLEQDLYLLILEEYIKDLEEEIGINTIIKRIFDNMPTDTKNPWTTPSIYRQEFYGNCPTCGLKLDQIMGYCCPNATCPTGLGPVMCSAKKD